jgi:AraC-like DNA-binding protein
MSCFVAEPQKNKYAMTNMEVRQYMSKEDDVFNRIFLYIEDHLTEKLTVEEIARQVYLSPTYLQSVFKENFGIPLAEYVRSQKLKRALELLYNTEKRISDIAYDSGFEHESSFIRSFKREFGMTPGEARRRKCYGGSLE